MPSARAIDWAARASIATWAERERANGQAQLVKLARQAAAEELARIQARIQSVAPKEIKRRGPYKCGLCGATDHNRARHGRPADEPKRRPRPSRPSRGVGRARNVTLEAEIMDALGWRWHGVADILHLVEQEYGTVGSTKASSKRLIIRALRHLEKEGHVLRSGSHTATVYRAARRRAERRRRFLNNFAYLAM